MKIKHLIWPFLFIFPALANGAQTPDKATQVKVINEVSTVITNDALINPVPVTSVSYPREPWQFHAAVEITPNDQLGYANFLTVPPDKMLVIEGYSLKASMPPGQRLRELWIQTVDGITHVNRQHFVRNSIDDLSSSMNIYYDQRQVRYYVGSGFDVLVNPVRDGGTTGTVVVDIWMSGYFLPADSPSLAP